LDPKEAIPLGLIDLFYFGALGFIGFVKYRIEHGHGTPSS
jgi:hypothetical protein